MTDISSLWLAAVAVIGALARRSAQRLDRRRRRTDEPTRMTSAFELDAAGSTDCGLSRSENQDRLLLLEEEGVFVVADGMGGHAGGGVASELAVNVIAESVIHLAANSLDVYGGSLDMPRAAAELVRAVTAANQAVRRTADSDDRLSDMGTTVVAARFCPKKQRLYVTHVGDSRCYRLRDGRMRQVTLDHTMNALGVTGPQEHHLSRAIGTRESVEPDVAVLRPRLGDAYVLCSDGLTKMVTDEDIAAVLTRPTTRRTRHRS
jgi:protein phosphatase